MIIRMFVRLRVRVSGVRGLGIRVSRVRG